MQLIYVIQLYKYTIIDINIHQLFACNEALEKKNLHDTMKQTRGHMTTYLVSKQRM